MDRQELYLKTAFCCMACDGDIAAEEVDAIRNSSIFATISDLQQKLQDFVQALKKEGKLFLHRYLNEVQDAELTEEEELQLAKVAIDMIEKDERVEYNEIAFFKKIRRRLKSSDEYLMQAVPETTIVDDKEDYFLPDITDADDLTLWNDSFIDIKISE